MLTYAGICWHMLTDADAWVFFQVARRTLDQLNALKLSSSWQVFNSLKYPFNAP
jgi:hypothetical protein